MTGIHRFGSQREGLEFFMRILLNAANRGWVSATVVRGFKETLGFEEEGYKGAIFPPGPGLTLVEPGAEPSRDQQVALFYLLTVAPMVAFYEAVVTNGDDTLKCKFAVEIVANKKADCLNGTAEWLGTTTEGRRVKIDFSDRKAVMTYNLGKRDGREILKSGFLGLPMEGDEVAEEEQNAMYGRPDIPMPMPPFMRT